MRLHNVIEKFRKAGKYKDIMSELEEAQAYYKEFDFGSIDPISNKEFGELQLYGLDLIKHDIFEMPYSHSIICWTNTITMQGTYVFKYVVLCKYLNKNELGLTVFVSYKDDNGFNNEICFTTGLAFAQTRISSLMTTFKPMWLSQDGSGFNKMDDELEVKFSQETVNDLVALVAMLDAEGIERREEIAPNRLNEKRIKRGKPPIKDCTTIFIKVGKKVVKASGENIHGTHASPRCHWRRGHLRHLPSGEIVKVRPCMVNVGSGEEPANKNYVIKRAG